MHQAVGIALECRRLDMVEAAVGHASGDAAKSRMIKHCLHLALTVVKSRRFRQEVLRLICALCSKLETPDSLSLCHCLIYLDDSNGFAQQLGALAKAGNVLMAYQIAYDLADCDNYPFQLRVINALPDAGIDEQVLKNLKYILSGESAIKLYTQFLHSQAKTDLGIMSAIKERVEGRNSVTHMSAIVSHAFMQCGTTHDQFIRDNLDWLTRANNWSKMSVTAAFGVIHKGYLQNSMRILRPYLPGEGSSNSPYLVSGALYGLGLIHANRGGDQLAYLEESLRNAGEDEVVQHGACLAIGLNAMQTSDDNLYDTLKGVLFHDNAVAGEAAGLAMGLVQLGANKEVHIHEMMAYANDTQHEKIVRGLGIGLALMVAGQEEHADGLITRMLGDKDPNIRYGGCFAIALAFACTAANSAINRLLHIAVSDVSTDVRRAAVIGLGFVLGNVPERVPKIVSLLCESYNPHVRYGAALAIGIACAATANRQAIELLTVLSKDRVDFVRQGGMLGLSMVLIQVNSAQEAAVEQHRTTLTTAIEGKHTDTQTKMGAILAQGILDAGGRNMTIALRSSSGHKRLCACAGLAVFTQYWYWYPLVHFLSLALAPTPLIGLNRNLAIPKNASFVCNARASLFDYPAVQQPKKEEEVKKVPTAQLSISAKAKQKAMKKKRGSGDADAMAVEPAESPSDKETVKGESADAAGESTTQPPAVTAPEPDHFTCPNQCRVTPSQRHLMSVEPGSRYAPVKKDVFGIIVLSDTRPDEPEELFNEEQPHGTYIQ